MPFVRLSEYSQVSIQFDRLNAVPEGAEYQPRRSVIGEGKVGIDGVEQVTSSYGFHNRPVINPLEVRTVRVQGVIGRHSDGGIVAPKRRDGVIEIIGPFTQCDVGGPPAISGFGVALHYPFGGSGEDRFFGLPRL